MRNVKHWVWAVLLDPGQPDKRFWEYRLVERLGVGLDDFVATLGKRLHA